MADISLDSGQKDNFKSLILNALKGCNYKRCLSSHCPNFINKSDDTKLCLLSVEEKLVHYLQLFKMGSLDISCHYLANYDSALYSPFRELIDFRFTAIINCTQEEADIKLKKLQISIEDLDRVNDTDRKKIILALGNSLNPEIISLRNLVQKNLSCEISLIIIKFIPLFHFLADIQFFYEFPQLGLLLSSINFKTIYSEELQRSLQNSSLVMPFLPRFIENIQNILTVNIIESQGNEEKEAYIKKIKELCEILRFFYLTNQILPLSVQVTSKLFINESVMTEVDIKRNLLLLLKGMLPRRLEEELNFRESQNPYTSQFNFLRYPFLFDTPDKIDILKLESYFLQDSEIENFLLNEPLGFNLHLLRNEIFLELVLRREHLLEDSLNQLALDSNIARLKRPLKVHFVNEPGVDEGGLTKEFFQLINSQLFAPSFGMFEEKNASYLWFDARSFECRINFNLVGILLGLALYNQVIIELPFPLVVFKKLILFRGSDEICNQLSLEDLFEVDPEIYFFLKNTLKEDMSIPGHGLTLSVEKDFYGEVRTYELIANGANIAVTNENKEIFVELFVKWYFEISIQAQFEPFAKGFFSVISGKVFQMFNATELFAALNGCENLDFNELKRSTQYDQGFAEDSETIKYFWEVLQSFEETKKRTFLKFLTGSSRAPLRGTGEIKMTISRNGDNKERLPSSHTCFNHLLLPDYKDLNILRIKLNHALDHCEGFGLS